VSNRNDSKLIQRKQISGAEFDEIGHTSTRPHAGRNTRRAAPSRDTAAYSGTVMADALQRRESAREAQRGEVNTPAKAVMSKSAAAVALPHVAERPAPPTGRLVAGNTGAVARAQAAPAAPARQQAAAQPLDFMQRSLNLEAQRQQQPAARPERPVYYPEQFGDDIRDIVLTYTSNANAMLITCVVACCLLLYAMIGTPLGSPLGIYSGPSSWSGWMAEHWGDDRPHVTQAASLVPPPALTASGESVIVGGPTISAQQIDNVLAEYGSPAAGSGQAFYDMGVKYGIDPAYALAFFIHESSAGTNPGWAGWKPDGSTTHNVGNIICAGYARCFNRFRDYNSWAEGIEDWYKLIAVEYVEGRGTTTVEQIIPIYAPSFENDVPAYVNAVTSLVDQWRSKSIR
jgi:hypothetical protein